MNREEMESTHQGNLSAARNYRQAQARLIDRLQITEQKNLHCHLGYSSMFEYVVQELKLSEQSAYNFIRVARKSVEVKELKEEIRSGHLGVAKATKLCSLLKVSNQGKLLKEARVMTTRQIEAKVFEEQGTPKARESVRTLGSDLHQLTLLVDSKTLEQLKLLQDLLSSKSKTPRTLSESVQEATLEFNRRHDPVQRAKRVKERKKQKKETPAKRFISKTEEQQDSMPSPATIHVNSPGKQRKALPARVLNAVNSRDGRRCAFISVLGKRCNQRRWLHLHHRLPVSQGGKHVVDNLITLCESHHRMVHKTMEKKAQNNGA